MGGDYYSQKLSANRLKRVYDIAPPRVRQYLNAEIAHVIGSINPQHEVLELGCGYGRVLADLAAKASWAAGIDTSLDSLQFARTYCRAQANVALAAMDAARLGFHDHTFDIVVCIQNGISAFHVDQHVLIEEALRVVRPGGLVQFSTYAARFWNDRLTWFELQADEGLLGEIDYQHTGDGVITCQDGFTATTVSPAEFRKLTEGVRAEVRLIEIDESSLFCELRP